MGKVFEALDDDLTAFVAKQHVFFVATAPSGEGGHVNLSPKGYDSFRVLDPNRVAYLDLTGSGVETIAHVRQNGRITFLFCAFEGPPKIVRLYGEGAVVVPGDDAFEALAARFPAMPGVRSIITAAISRVSTSCGYAVPFMAFEKERAVLNEAAVRKGEETLARYRDETNAVSIDGIRGLAEVANRAPIAKGSSG